MDTTSVGRDGQIASALDKDWASVASLLQRKMRDGSYQFTGYREILLSKGAHSFPRVVAVATARDRIVLKALATVLKQLFPAASTPLAQVRVSELVSELALAKFDSFVRIDVKNFYPSISHIAIRHQLLKRVRQRTLLSLILRAISTPTVGATSARPNYSTLVGVPQGLPVSNLLAEISMSEVDASYQFRSDAAYFRYVDDILVLCHSGDSRRHFQDIESLCAGIGLVVHGLAEGSKSEIGSLSKPFDYLGYRFSPGSVSVRPASVRKLEATILRLFTAYKYLLASNPDPSWQAKATESLRRRLDIVIAGCVFENIPRGWVQYFSQMNDFTLLSRLDALVSQLVRRFGLPVGFVPKSFVRAYWHVARPNASTPKYIQNFDRFTEVDRRAFLSALFPGQQFAKLKVAELNARFTVEVRRLVSMLERDISEIS